MLTLEKLANQNGFCEEELRDALLDICCEENSAYVDGLGIQAQESKIINEFNWEAEFAVLFRFQGTLFGYYEKAANGFLSSLDNSIPLKDWVKSFCEDSQLF